MEVRIGNRPLRIAVGAGHHNTSGGNAFETELNGRVTYEVVDLLRHSSGFEVRCYTPGDGIGWYNGPLDAAARQVVAWAKTGWVADIFHEIHHEGTGTPAIRGGFVIYPDGAGLSSPYPNPGDIDIDVRDHGRRMTELLCGAVGLPIRGNGTMSERATGVGAQGYRLGIFAATAVAPLIDGVCRFITECGAYTNPEDRVILGRADFSRRQARGIAAMYADLAVNRLGWTFPHRIEGGAATAPIPPVPVTSGPRRYASPVSPPVWDGRDKEVNGVTFRAVRRVVVAVRPGLPALQFADFRSRPVRAPIGKGETFEVLFVVEGEAGPWWVTTSGARVPMAGTAPRVTIDDAA